VRCDVSHRAPDDPIVHPGHAGMAHSHDFFANTDTNHSSTYDTLREADTTCTRPEDTAAYWLPTVSWNGEVLDSNRAIFYYRTGGKNHKNVKPFPAELKVIARNPKYVSWRCGRLDNGGGSRTRRGSATTASWAYPWSSPSAGTGDTSIVRTTARTWPTAGS
jgi:hypothetical protein